MVDTLTPAQRSAVMSRIRSVETKPEVRFRKALFARGFRYRKNVTKLPGRPDIVLAGHLYIVQIRGCFWHAHKNCRRASRPSSNTDYWLPKLARNVARDKASDRLLRKMGWRVRVVWECEILSEANLQKVASHISDDIRCASK